MPYFSFLLYFVVLPAVALTLLVRPTRNEWRALLWLLIVVYVWTTPWDNYLVGSGVWYYDPRLVSGVVWGWVPLEEYLFFGCLTWLTSLWVFALRRMLHQNGARVASAVRRVTLGSLIFLGALFLAVFFFHAPHSGAAGAPAQDLPPLPFGSWNYLALIVVWAVPVLVGQAWLGWPMFRKQKWVYGLGFGVPAVYLTLLDALAIGSGTWTIAPSQSLNIFLPFGVPLEEGVFFLAANLLVVQGIFLFTSPVAQVTQRLRPLLSRS